MNADKLFNIFGGIVTVALVTTVVTSRQTAGIVRAVGDTFSKSLKAAMGN